MAVGLFTCSSVERHRLLAFCLLALYLRAEAGAFLPFIRSQSLDLAAQPLQRVHPPQLGGLQLGWRSRSAVRRGADSKGTRDAVKGGIGGAVLGGLLLGPFGAVFGASLGADFGRRRAEDEAALEELGLDQEMVQLAQRVGADLAAASQDRERMAVLCAELSGREVRLESEVRAKYAEAEEALRGGEEGLAREALAAKLAAQGRLSTVEADLRKAEQRCESLDRGVKRLELRALQVADLLQRAKRASGPQRTALAAEASALGVSAPRDPLLDRFDALERGESRP